MSDLVYSEKLCGLKKYFINYTDKGRWNPSSPMINIDNEVVIFALEQCNNGAEMLEYIDNLLEVINED